MLGCNFDTPESYNYKVYDSKFKFEFFSFTWRQILFVLKITNCSTNYLFGKVFILKTITRINEKWMQKSHIYFTFSCFSSLFCPSSCWYVCSEWMWNVRLIRCWCRCYWRYRLTMSTARLQIEASLLFVFVLEYLLEVLLDALLFRQLLFPLFLFVHLLLFLLVVVFVLLLFLFDPFPFVLFLFVVFFHFLFVLFLFVGSQLILSIQLAPSCGYDDLFLCFFFLASKFRESDLLEQPRKRILRMIEVISRWNIVVCKADMPCPWFLFWLQNYFSRWKGQWLVLFEKKKEKLYLYVINQSETFAELSATTYRLSSDSIIST